MKRARLNRQVALKAKAQMTRKRQLRRSWMKRNTGKARENKDAQREFSQSVRARDGHTCRRCGATDHLEAHHILPRGRGGQNTPRNGVTLCSGCHAGVHERAVDDWHWWIQSARAKRLRAQNPLPPAGAPAILCR